MRISVAAALSVAALVVGAGCAPLTPPLELHGPVPPPADAEAFDVALFQTTGAHLRGGHRWRLEDDGRVFAALVDDIGHARTSVDIVSYIWHSGEPSDRILAALERRAHGVACRILADPLGSPDFAKNVEPRLRAVGCATALFRPLGDHALPERNHRKLAIVDGRIGYVGGFGVRHEWVEASGSGDPEYFPRVDPDGDARVAFVSSSFAYVTAADRLTLLTIAAARKRLWLWNAYFAPDEHLAKLLADKARAGVDVRILMPGDKNDVTAAKLAQRHSYPPLAAAGVRLYEYQPTMMHAKAMLVDDRVAVVGSINLDALSLTRLEEDAVVVDDPALVAAMARDWDVDVAHSRAVRPQAVRSAASQGHEQEARGSRSNLRAHGPR